MSDDTSKTTITYKPKWLGGLEKIVWRWRPSPTLRFREMGERGMILEQLFLGTAFGQPTQSEWRPVPVVPQSEGVQE